MPLKQCTSDNETGWKWGDEGTCYTGPDGKKKAIKQGVAIEGPEKFSEKAIEAELLFEPHEIGLILETMGEAGYGYLSQTAVSMALRANASTEPYYRWEAF